MFNDNDNAASKQSFIGHSGIIDRTSQAGGCLEKEFRGLRKTKQKQQCGRLSYPIRSMSSLSPVGEVCTISFFSSPISSAKVSISCKRTERAALNYQGIPKEEEEVAEQ